MDRRKFTAIAGIALATPRALLAQPVKRVFRIALLDDAAESARDTSWKVFRDRLRSLVLADSNDVAYEARYARGISERLPALAAELVALKPDIIVCPGTPAAIAAMKATAKIPVVFIGAGDPAGTGLVASLSRPGGNVTGISNFGVEIAGKQLELLHELSAGAKRIVYLTDTSNKASVEGFRQVQARSRDVHITAQMLDGRTRSNLERSFEAIKRQRVQALIVSAAGPLLEHREQIVQFAAMQKLPVVYGRREYVDSGGFVSYSAEYTRMFSRGAEYAHRILSGAQPGELPVERSSNFFMALNLKTARALSITVPATVRLRADEVIE